MTMIAILPEKINGFRAIAGKKESRGRTAGEALDALTKQLANDEGNLFVIVQKHKADEFFDETQQKRLTELMRRKSAGKLTSDEKTELEQLIEAELRAATRRAENLAGGLLP
jgi:hypothetical protein